MAGPTTRLALDWLQLAALIGAVQGLFLAGTLFAQRNNRTANRLLGVLMLTFTIFLGSTVYYTTSLFERWPHFFGVSYHTPFVFGPLVYLYARAASDRSWRFGGRAWLHFVPVAITIAATFPMYLLSGPEKVALLQEFMAGNVPTRLIVFDVCKYVSGIVYSIATVLLVLRHGREVRDNYSNVERVNLRWLLWITGAAAAIWLLAVVVSLAGDGVNLRDDWVALSIALLVYSIGYMGLKQPEIFRFRTAEFRTVTADMTAVMTADTTADKSADTKAPDGESYQRSGLSDAEAEQLRVALISLMETAQPWKDSDLTLPQLAEQLGTTSHKLSEVLNAQMRQTFYDFVNGYRVREVQRRIKAGDAAKLKMLALAMDAGFASKSTFNEVFKKHTNMTPSAFAMTDM